MTYTQQQKNVRIFKNSDIIVYFIHDIFILSTIFWFAYRPLIVLTGVDTSVIISITLAFSRVFKPISNKEPGT